MVTATRLFGALGIFCAAALAWSCSGGGDDDPGASSTAPTTGSGICADERLKACATDNDCNPSEGELCGGLGADGKACMEASDCPVFCSSDSRCDTAEGEACLRATLESPRAVCAEPDDALKLCSGDDDCDGKSVCCEIYEEPVCLPPDQCPKVCDTGTDCNTAAGEVCCTTLKLEDKSLGADGICIDPELVPCPRACEQSSDCDTRKGEVCCDGVCQTSCVKRCNTSSDCCGQICCLTTAERSPWVRGYREPGYQVPEAPTGGGAAEAEAAATGAAAPAAAPREAVEPAAPAETVAPARRS